MIVSAWRKKGAGFGRCLIVLCCSSAFVTVLRFSPEHAQTQRTKPDLRHRRGAGPGRCYARPMAAPCPFPIEAELCKQFGASRTVLREAVKMLTAKAC